MRKAYIILAHKNPEQLVRLIEALDDNQSTFFIHLDKKADSSELRKIVLQSTHTALVERVSTDWAGFGIVEATLNCMKAIANHPAQFDFIILLSGQHYPIKSNEYINDYLSSASHRIFLEHTALPDYGRWTIRGGLYRIDKYFMGARYYQRMTAKALNFLGSHIDFIKRKFPQSMKPYAGSQWWTMDNYSLQYILDFIKKNEDYVAYHKYTFAPDELFFHNILLNADDDKIQSGITNDNLLLMHWPDSNHAHPEILDHTAMGLISQSDALFARKFDMNQDAVILDLIDEWRA